MDVDDYWDESTIDRLYKKAMADSQFVQTTHYVTYLSKTLADVVEENDKVCVEQHCFLNFVHFSWQSFSAHRDASIVFSYAMRSN